MLVNLYEFLARLTPVLAISHGICDTKANEYKCRRSRKQEKLRHATRKQMNISVVALRNRKNYVINKMNNWLCNNLKVIIFIFAAIYIEVCE